MKTILKVYIPEELNSEIIDFAKAADQTKTDIVNLILDDFFSCQSRARLLQDILIDVEVLKK